MVLLVVHILERMNTRADPHNRDHAQEDSGHAVNLEIDRQLAGQIADQQSLFAAGNCQQYQDQVQAQNTGRKQLACLFVLEGRHQSHHQTANNRKYDQYQ